MKGLLKMKNILIFILLVVAGCNQQDSKLGLGQLSEKIPYDRKLYGGWIDQDGDCQNTRHEILEAQSTSKPVYKTKRGCRVVSGTWVGPYSKKTFYKASRLDIDHIIPLKFAHQIAGYAWTKQKRVEFANDPENLLATSARLNRQKGAKGPVEWMPPKGKCAYLKKWKHVADKYEVPVKTEVLAMLKDCKKERNV